MSLQPRSEETRERLMQAALASFAERGYDATGVAEICQRAGVSKGAFYYHFASKQALFLALLDQWLAALEREMTRLAAPSAPAAQSLQAKVGLLQQVFRDASGRLLMYLEVWRQAARDETIWQATVAPFQRYHALLAGMIEQGIVEGSLRSCDPQEAARALVSMAVGMVLQSALDPTGNNWERSAQLGVELFLTGLP
ncbi:MAG: TetR/AcrR family transcriptional regulator [Anaerolinea sp.]|nr:TetR/AcrR family transcriptional regulator [Anaerolinea sp.]